MNPTVIVWIENLIILLLGLMVWSAVIKAITDQVRLVPAITFDTPIAVPPSRRRSLIQEPLARHGQAATARSRILFFTN